MTPQIIRIGTLLEVQGVQNSSFELQRALFTVLVEEKAIGLKICVFCPSSLFPLPVEEKACKTSKTRVLSFTVPFSLCWSRKMIVGGQICDFARFPFSPCLSRK